MLYATTLVPLDAETLGREAASGPKVVLVEPAYEGTSAGQIAAALSHRPTQLLSPLECSGLKPQFLEKMAANGVVLPPSFFGEQRGGRPTFAAAGFGGFQ